MTKPLSEEDRSRARTRLVAGRIRATQLAPYFSSALFALTPIERLNFGTFAVDTRWRMYYDPQCCLDWTVDEIAAVWLHEVGHVVRGHGKRYEAVGEGSKNSHIWNASADASINSDLRDAKILLPDADRRYYAEPNAQFPDWRRNMTTEELYRRAGGKRENNLPPADESSEDGDTGESTQNSEPEDQDTDSASSSEEPQEDSSTNEDSSKEPKEDVEKSDSSDDTSGSSDSEDPDEQADPTDSNEDTDSSASSDRQETEEDAGSSDTPGSEGESSEGEPSDDNSDADGSGAAEGDVQAEEDSEGGKASSADSSSADGQGDPSDSNSDASENSTDEHDSAQPHDCGSGATGGPPRDYEEKSTDDGSVDEGKAEQIRQQVAEDIIAHNDRYGNVPGGWVREAEDILDPKVDWRKELNAVVRRVSIMIAGKKDYSYSKPSRRSAGSSFFFPSLRQPRPPEIAIVLDTSGSMTKKELSECLTEISEIIRRVSRSGTRVLVRVINCDAGASEVQMVKEISTFEILGGGGTDMRVGIKAASELTPTPDLIITMTDGGTPWPREIPTAAPRARYIALLVGKQSPSSYQRPDIMKIPEWMHTIVVD